MPSEPLIVAWVERSIDYAVLHACVQPHWLWSLGAPADATDIQLLDEAKKRRSEEGRRWRLVFDGFWHFQSFWLKLSKVGSHRQSKKLDSGRSCHEPISFAFILPLCSKGCKGVIFYPDSALSLSPNLARPSNTKHSAHPPLAVYRMFV